MNIWDAVQNQFIEVIEWLDEGTENIVYRFPVAGQEIKMGAQLIVRESQTAVFINEGKIADVFTAGTYVLSTQNMPVLTKLKSWKYMFNSPFKAEVYFINTKQFLNQKWGTSNPVLMRDKEFGMIRLRGYGIFSYRVNNPSLFLMDIYGTNVNLIGGIIDSKNAEVFSLLLQYFETPDEDRAEEEYYYVYWSDVCGGEFFLDRGIIDYQESFFSFETRRTFHDASELENSNGTNYLKNYQFTEHEVKSIPTRWRPSYFGGLGFTQYEKVKDDKVAR